MRVFPQTRLLKEKETNLLKAPLHSPNQSRKLGGIESRRRRRRRRRGSFRNVQGLLYSNAPAFLARTSLTNKHTRTDTQTHNLIGCMRR